GDRVIKENLKTTQFPPLTRHCAHTVLTLAKAQKWSRHSCINLSTLMIGRAMRGDAHLKGHSRRSQTQIRQQGFKPGQVTLSAVTLIEPWPLYAAVTVWL
ncbi:Erythronate-4-phosphate dehydrogenase, partial [Dissostichus eleginoides]